MPHRTRQVPKDLKRLLSSTDILIMTVWRRHRHEDLGMSTLSELCKTARFPETCPYAPEQVFDYEYYPEA
jgi:hypothetical protein